MVDRFGPASAIYGCRLPTDARAVALNCMPRKLQEVAPPPRNSNLPASHAGSSRFRIGGGGGGVKKYEAPAANRSLEETFSIVLLQILELRNIQEIGVSPTVLCWLSKSSHGGSHPWPKLCATSEWRALRLT